MDELKRTLNVTKLCKDSPGFRHFSETTGISPSEPTSLSQLIRRPEVEMHHVLSLLPEHLRNELADGELAVVVNDLKYSGYVESQKHLAEKLEKLETRRIPSDLDFAGVAGLSREMVEKLTRVRPRTLGQARRIPGVTPAAIAILNIHLELWNGRGKPHI
jgi:tRNA uridine 5-carboxymethylaminomethyl modification enzyme